MRFGLTSGKPMQYRSIAKRLGMSFSHVQRVVADAIQSVRRSQNGKHQALDVPQDQLFLRKSA
jgi:hypothetical protein